MDEYLVSIDRLQLGEYLFAAWILLDSRGTQRLCVDICICLMVSAKDSVRVYTYHYQLYRIRMDDKMCKARLSVSLKNSPNLTNNY